jgi:uncharacterized membrane protein
LINIQDAAIVTWHEDRDKPKMKQLDSLSSTRRFNDAFWGVLFSVVFTDYFFSMPAAASNGILTSQFSTYGISSEFIIEIQRWLNAGCSALVLLLGDEELDKLLLRFEGQSIEVISVQLTSKQEEGLYSVFGNER